MQLPSIDSLCRSLDLTIDGFQPELITRKPPYASVYRLNLERRAGSLPFDSLILKQYPGSSHGSVPNEIRFYREILTHMEFPQPRVYSVEQDKDGTWLVFFEDLGNTHTFHKPDYRWTAEELRNILAVYACLHKVGIQHLPEAGKRDWLFSYAVSDLSLEEIPDVCETLVNQGIWPAPLPVRGLLDELKAYNYDLNALQPTILHNDLYPPNVALPRSAETPIILVDWEMAGWGAAELDLAYLFVQPFRSGQALSHAEAVDCYWQARRSIEASIPPAGERRKRQRYADLFMTLWLIPLLAKGLASSFPRGNLIREYWRGMQGVLYERMCVLIEGQDYA